MYQWARWIDRLAVPLIIGGSPSLLFFRFFITLDGPMHVLHASVLEASWTTPRYIADGVAYNVDMLDVQLGDFLLMVLLHLGDPLFAHAAFAAIVLAALGTSSYFLARAMGGHVSAWILWVLPLSFSYVLVLGFLHFLLVLAFTLGVTTWWVSRQHITIREVLVLVLALAGAHFIHRVGPIMLFFFITAMELGAVIDVRSMQKRRWTLSRWRTPVAIAAIAVGVCLTVLGVSIWVGITHVPTTGHDPVRELLTLRPLVLLAPDRERPMVLALGILFLASLVLATRERLRTGMRWQNTDPVWLAACALILASVLVLSTRSVALYLGERLQLIALLLLVIWMATMRVHRMAHILVAAVVVVHAWRVLHIEATMAGLRPQYDDVMEATAHLSPGSTVLGITSEPNWLLLHLGAFAAIHHDGILLSRREHLNFIFDDPQLPTVVQYFHRKGSYLGWLHAHNKQGRRPVIGHVLIVGYGNARQDSVIHMLDAPLRNWYDSSFANASTSVYTRRSE